MNPPTKEGIKSKDTVTVWDGKKLSVYPWGAAPCGKGLTMYRYDYWTHTFRFFSCDGALWQHMHDREHVDKEFKARLLLLGAL